MPHSSPLDQLRQAVQKELSDEALRASRCDSFLEKIIQYQNGQGSLPDEQQFLLWREDLKKTVAVRALTAGLDLPERDDQADEAAPPAAGPSVPIARERRNGGLDAPAS